MIESKITLVNNGTGEGTVDKVIDVIPKGTIFEQEDNPDWTLDNDGNAIYNKKITLSENQMKEIEIVTENEEQTVVKTEIVPKCEEQIVVETETTSEKEEQTVIDTKDKLICPKCGASLVLRTAKKGNNMGEQFYGCTGFPKCRFILKIEEQTSQI